MPVMNSAALHRGIWDALSVDYVLFPSLAKTFFSVPLLGLLFSRQFYLLLFYVQEAFSRPSVHFLKFDFFNTEQHYKEVEKAFNYGEFQT